VTVKESNFESNLPEFKIFRLNPKSIPSKKENPLHLLTSHPKNNNKKNPQCVVTMDA